MDAAEQKMKHAMRAVKERPSTHHSPEGQSHIASFAKEISVRQEKFYAALLSLKQALEGFLHQIHHYDRQKIENLLKKVLSLLNFVKKIRSISFLQEIFHLRFDEMAHLEIQLEDACSATALVTNLLKLNQDYVFLTHRGESRITRFPQDIQNVMIEMDFIEKKVIKVKERLRAIKEHCQINSSSAGVSRLVPTDESSMVGFQDDLDQITERLTSKASNLQIIPILGMGGMGKTTLAKNVYENCLIVEHFDIRVWATVSQEYDVRKILLALLGKIDEEGDHGKLGVELHKKLFGRRYLIVMDDVWSTQVWEEVRRFIPNSNGSGIILTTRDSNVAHQFGSAGIHEMNFLDQDKSWNLFCEKAFPEKCCPLELENIGKRIAKSCGGLPLALVVIGGLLAKSDRTKQYWEYVDENIASLVNLENGADVHKLLYLSYSYMPLHLKPCFLYMASFQEDVEIAVSTLIRLWVAEGILKPIRDKTLEDVAMDYLEDLIHRSLILVCRRSVTGKIHSCIMHDLVRDLSLREACKRNFLYVTKGDVHHRLEISPAIQNKRRLCIHGSNWKPSCSSEVVNVFASVSSARSFLCKFDCDSTPHTSSLRLLRVLDVLHDYHPEEIRQLVNIRFLRFCNGRKLVPNRRFTCSISLFWNLQTLIIRGRGEITLENLEFILPSEIWNMPQLRHLNICDAILPDPPLQSGVPNDNSYVLENLHTLSRILNFRCTEEIARRVPNLKKLKIKNSKWPEDYCIRNIVNLHKLEKLNCWSGGIDCEGIAFPLSLKELKLWGLGLPWEEMTIVGSLPNLELLRLSDNAFTGPEWNVEEGEFARLKYLEIGYSDLMYWRADHTRFPSLRQLKLEYCEQLEEIPLGFAESDTLRLIQLEHCSESAVASAGNIREECENLGNEALKIHVTEYREDGKGFIDSFSYWI